MKYKKLSQDGKKVIKIFKKDEDYSKSELFDYQKYAFGNPGTYQIINNSLDIFNHDSYNEL